MNLTDHRINEIFAGVKKVDASQTVNMELNKEEFAVALKYIQDKNFGLSLELLGVSTSSLTVILVTITIILCLLFGFIFIGIEAFALGGMFGAVINSIIPAGILCLFI